jgi:uncharacterized phage-associated protein
VLRAAGEVCEVATVHDVMAYIRERLPAATPMQRHKLAYYAQGWHAAWEGRALYIDRIEAWEHGPVVRDAWVADTYGPSPHTEPLSEGERSVVDAVLTFYGGLTAGQLRTLTHLEGPWIRARGGLPEGARCSTEIPVSDMRTFYTRRAMMGEGVPTRPVLNVERPADETSHLVDEGIERWREALEKLAAR